MSERINKISHPSNGRDIAKVNICLHNGPLEKAYIEKTRDNSPLSWADHEMPVPFLILMWNAVYGEVGIKSSQKRQRSC